MVGPVHPLGCWVWVFSLVFKVEFSEFFNVLFGEKESLSLSVR